MRKIFVSLLFLALSPVALSHGLDALVAEKTYWMKFKAKDKYERTTIANLGVTIEAIVEDHVMAIGSEEDLVAAKKTGQLLMSFPLTHQMKDFPIRDEQFHNYSELWQAMRALANAHPDLIKMSTIGRSTEGRDIPLLTFSIDGQDTTRPAVFYMGGHHAREHVSIEVPLKFAQYLAAEFAAGNERIVSLLKSRTVYIAPMVNPDGAEYDIASGSYRLWRKSRKNNGSNVFGVDLNRNYGFGWGGGGASTSPRHDTYRGTSAFSEPETQAIKAFTESHENINILLSFHTFSKLILYPWGHQYEKIPNAADLRVHETMATTMAKWNGYEPQQSSELYIASGDTTDWSYGQLGIISFTFELDPGGGSSAAAGFYPGQSAIEPTFRKNIEPCLYLLENADNPYRVNEPKYMSYGLKSPLLR
jgi:carboxypeptidase T